MRRTCGMRVRPGSFSLVICARAVAGHEVGQVDEPGVRLGQQADQRQHRLAEQRRELRRLALRVLDQVRVGGDVIGRLADRQLDAVAIGDRAPLGRQRLGRDLLGGRRALQRPGRTAPRYVARTTATASRLRKARNSSPMRRSMRFNCQWRRWRPRAGWSRPSRTLPPTELRWRRRAVLRRPVPLAPAARGAARAVLSPRCPRCRSRSRRRAGVAPSAFAAVVTAPLPVVAVRNARRRGRVDVAHRALDRPRCSPPAGTRRPTAPA